jgi:hypothetical protein
MVLTSFFDLAEFHQGHPRQALQGLKPVVVDDVAPPGVFQGGVADREAALAVGFDVGDPSVGGGHGRGRRFVEFGLNPDPGHQVQGPLGVFQAHAAFPGDVLQGPPAFAV